MGESTALPTGERQLALDVDQLLDAGGARAEHRAQPVAELRHVAQARFDVDDRGGLVLAVGDVLQHAARLVELIEQLWQVCCGTARPSPAMPWPAGRAKSRARGGARQR
jgi:hypothetical protein